MIKFIGSILAAGFTALLLGSATANGAPISAFDNLTGEPTFDGSAPPVTTTIQRALRFTAGAAGNVLDVTVPISLRSTASGTAELSFAFFTDGVTAPGSQIGSSAIGSSSSPGYTPELVTISGWSGVSLMSGTNYWLTASLAANSPEGYWYFADDRTVAGERFESDNAGTTWFSTAAVHQANIRIDPIPLPAGFPLLLGGLGVLAFAARRKKKHG